MKNNNNKNMTEEEYLRSYDVSNFERPSVTVDMLVFTVVNEEEKNYRKLPQKSLKLLLVNRGQHPFIHKWALPGGFVGMSESLEEAAIRELKTETNVDNIYMEQLYTWGDAGRDPRTRVISCSYMALVDSSGFDVKAGDDAAEAGWFNVECKKLEDKKTQIENGFVAQKLIELKLTDGRENLSAKVMVTVTTVGRTTNITRKIVESAGLAFDHAMMIEYAIERLKNKIEYTDIAFNLMPELFTLSELQQVYEVILDKELLAAAFRRKVADMVIETEEYTKDAGHRPSKFYRFNPSWKEI